MGKYLEQTLGVLTGTVGDYLARTGNSLATPMTLVHAGEPLPLTRSALAAAYPQATSHAVLLVHGLMATEHCFAFSGSPPDAQPEDYATLLQRAHGWTPLYLRYNTGASMAESARDLAHLLDQLVAVWPVPLRELAVVCHSMGGLVVRGACALAASDNLLWLQTVQRVAYLGTPHLGAPLERAGRWATQLLRRVPDPVAQLVGQVADLRSLGIQELGDHAAAQLVPGVKHLLVAGTLAEPTQLQAWLGDGMVSVDSAQAGLSAADLPAHVALRRLVGVSHAGLAYSPQAGQLLVEWLIPDVLVTASPDATGPDDPAPAPAQDRQRMHGLFELTQAAVLHGNRAVERVRLRRGDQVFAILQTVPGIRGPVRVAQAVHDAVVVSGHSAVEVVTQAAGEVHQASFPKRAALRNWLTGQAALRSAADQLPKADVTAASTAPGA